MALIAAGSGVAAYLNTVDVNRNVLLGAALLTFSVWPYTLLAVMPTNEQLLDGDGMYQRVTKRCRLSLLTNSALVYESQCGRIGGVVGLSQ
jgi:hypothetical protein